MSFVSDLKSVITITRSRLTLDSVETYFLAMSVFATLGMIFQIFAGAYTYFNQSTNLELYQIFVLLGLLFLAITLGLLIFLTSMLSIYFDDIYRLVRDPVYSSNFTFTRLVTPVARGLILLIALLLLLYSVSAFMYSPTVLPVP